MSKVNMQAWIAALESGEFKHGTRRLRRVIKGIEHFCCLGVACEVYRRTTGKGRWLEQEPEQETALASGKTLSFTVDEYEYVSSLPNSVVNWLGLRDNVPFFNSVFLDSVAKDARTLAGVNDQAPNYNAAIEAIKTILLPAVED